VSSRPVSSNNQLVNALDYASPHAATTYHKITSPWLLVGPE